MRINVRTATVTVTQPCTCGSKRWFNCAPGCPSWEVLAEYDCQLFDGVEGAPHPQNVAHIHNLHPGATLRYLSLGAEHQRLIAAEMARQ